MSHSSSSVSSLSDQLAQLARRERMIRQVLESTNSYGYEWETTTGVMTWFGDAEPGLERLPRSRAELRRRLHPDDQIEFDAAIAAALASREPFQLTYRVVGAGESVRFWQDAGRPFPDDDAASTVIVGSCTDVTDQRRVETQLLQAQKLEAVGLLAGGIAHDFNNLLSVIQGYGELLREQFTTTDPGIELVDEVMHAVRRASSLTRQLLIFSRRQVLQPRVLDVREVVQGMFSLLERVLGEDLALELHTAAVVPNVYADPGQLEQVVMNLAVNARDAMARGGVIQLRLGETAQGWAFLEVHDTGEGIPDDVQARMFEPFFTTKPAGRGTGLGLSTVHGIVHQSGGAISVESAVGEGSTFRVELPPAAPGVPEVAPRPVSRAGEARAEAAGRVILLVEDEPVVAALVRRLLRDLGYEVVLANSVPEARFLLSQLERAPDLVVTDMIMPGGTGRELATSLATSHPDVPVLFMSGYTEDMLDRHAGGLSPDMPFLEKPFTQEALARAVRQTMHPATRPTPSPSGEAQPRHA